MLQTIDGHVVYVVEFQTWPNLPVVGTGVEQYYAEALTDAIKLGTIKTPGKYAIEVNFLTFPYTYNVFAISEEEEDPCSPS